MGDAHTGRQRPRPTRTESEGALARSSGLPSTPAAGRLRRPSHVSMMQPAHGRKLDNLTHLRPLHGTRLRRVLAERQVRAARVVVLGNEPAKQSPQVPLVHDNDVVEQLAAQGADHTLDFSGTQGVIHLAAVS
jgi:hypothetical protein